jgi:hypothetical protein
MNDIYDISSIFDNILDNKIKDDILKCIEDLYINKYINTEILFNIIKAFVIIFSVNSNYANIYYYILSNLSEKNKIKIFSYMTNINLSNQVNISDHNIENIILSINQYIVRNYITINILEIFTRLYNLYEIINRYNIPLDIKIQLFIIFLNKNISIIEIRHIIILIQKYIV